MVYLCAAGVASAGGLRECRRVVLALEDECDGVAALCFDEADVLLQGEGAQQIWRPSCCRKFLSQATTSDD